MAQYKRTRQRRRVRGGYKKLLPTVKSQVSRNSLDRLSSSHEGVDKYGNME